MAGLRAWLMDRFAERPWWMNALMVFCAFLTFIYMPWDFFIKPVAADEEAWFGLLLRGPAAKLTEPIHWAIYAAGLYGFWNMRPWMWPWASLYVATVAFGMLVWGVVYVGGFGGFVLGVLAAIPIALIARALWTSAELFEPRERALRERYGPWAVVTGASAGIGAEFARALARDGLSVVLVARREDRLRQLASELESTFGVSARAVAADLAAPGGAAQVARACAGLEVGVLVNNAGAGYAGLFEHQDADRLRDMIALNCAAPVLLTRALLPEMLSRRRGAVVIVGSVAGRQPIPLHAVYSATKGFDVLFGESIWVELRERGVDVLVLQPGPVATEFEAVAGERRPHPADDEDARDTVRVALDALGRKPSVVSGTRMNWLRANASRFLPRTVIAFVAGDFMARLVPPERREPS
jgi:short-subunit dehydrogenase